MAQPLADQEETKDDFPAGYTGPVHDYIIRYPTFPGVWGRMAIAAPKSAEELKEIIRKNLGLNSKSLSIFGLFFGEFYTLSKPSELAFQPQELVVEIVPHCPLQQWFMAFGRLCFDDDEEKIIIGEDSAARDLIFCEAEYRLHKKLLLPKPDQETDKLLKKMYYEDIGGGNIDKDEFLRIVRSDHWSYYYRADECTMVGVIDPDLYYCLWIGTAIRVALGYENVTFLDVHGEKELYTLPWSQVYCLKKLSTFENGLVTFEVLYKMGDEYVLRSIPVGTYQYTYLYSIGLHILEIREKKLKLPKQQVLPPFCKQEICDSTSDAFMNKTWEGEAMVVSEDFYDLLYEKDKDFKRVHDNSSISKESVSIVTAALGLAIRNVITINFQLVYDVLEQSLEYLQEQRQGTSRSTQFECENDSDIAVEAGLYQALLKARDNYAEGLADIDESLEKNEVVRQVSRDLTHRLSEMTLALTQIVDEANEKYDSDDSDSFDKDYQIAQVRSDKVGNVCQEDSKQMPTEETETEADQGVLEQESEIIQTETKKSKRSKGAKRKSVKKSSKPEKPKGKSSLNSTKTICYKKNLATSSKKKEAALVMVNIAGDHMRNMEQQHRQEFVRRSGVSYEEESTSLACYKELVLDYVPSSYRTTYAISVFGPPWVYNVRVNGHPRMITAEDILLELSEVTKLQKSIVMFGLFEGIPGSPVKLFGDEEFVPVNVPLFLGRLSFLPAFEANMNLTAKILLFLELKQMYKKNKMLLLGSFANIYTNRMLQQSEDLQQYLAQPMKYYTKSSNEMNEELTGMILRFFPNFQTVHECYYWELYYRVNCYVDVDTITPIRLAMSHIDMMVDIQVAFNYSRILFIKRLTYKGKYSVLFTLPWDSVCCLKVQKSPKSLCMFEVLIIENDYCMIRNICVVTDSVDYLFSLGDYILQIRKLYEPKATSGDLKSIDSPPVKTSKISELRLVPAQTDAPPLPIGLQSVSRHPPVKTLTKLPSFMPSKALVPHSIKKLPLIVDLYMSGGKLYIGKYYDYNGRSVIFWENTILAENFKKIVGLGGTVATIVNRTYKGTPAWDLRGSIWPSDHPVKDTK